MSDFGYLPRVTMRRRRDGRGYDISVDGVPVPNVTEIDYRRPENGFPIVTLYLVAEFYTDDEPSPPGDGIAPWREEAQ